MSDPKIIRDDPMVAAEWALGLLEGEELLAARGKMANDTDFAARKEWWDNWFAPWTDEVAAMEPDPDVWSRIAAHVNNETGAETSAETSPQTRVRGEVIDLTARLKRWQWTAGLTSAAAAVMLAVTVFAPGSGPADPVAPTPGTSGTTQLATADPLVAQVPIGDTGLRLDVTYIPDSERMLIGAIGLSADGVHDHELWLVPADGSALQSLGVVVPGEVQSVELPQDISQNLGDGVNLVLTREPIGGKPDGQDAGPVVAEGAFSQV